jgi:aspartyl-tRNA(Asn)/glutamyl-tRNA(Gln) amidotransferase subunit A
MAENLSCQTLTELARALAQGEASSRAIVAAYLDRIDAHDGWLHAFVEVWREDALAQADAADSERRAGRACGPLHGLPVALKDLFHVDGRQTTAGSKSWHGRISDHTATTVARLLAAGMIPLGKTHMVEFAFGGWGRNAPMGAPWNPWDPRMHRVAGGSSSGSAVAVAAGFAPVALGSDTGGSIRIPASLCGITGLKPTYGLVSLHGTVPLSPTLDSIGPIARTAEDAALLVAAMAGPDPDDAATRAAPRVDFAAALAAPPDLRGTRITVLAPERFPSYTEAEVARATHEAATVLGTLGATIVFDEVPLDLDALAAANGRIIAAEAWAFHRAYIEDPALDIDPWVRRRVVGGKAISAAEYDRLLAERRRAMAAFAEWMRGRDVLLTPTLPITATAVNEVDEATTPLAAFTRAANYLAACALSLPAGFSSAGLPIGVQLMGAPFADATLVRIGRAFQAATDWHRRQPELPARNPTISASPHATSRPPGP